MCDVCDGTLFNFHWACDRCGFVVCIDCYRCRREDRPTRVWGVSEKDRDAYSWLLCTTRQQHELEKLMLVQIIAGEALESLSEVLKAAKDDAEENGGDEEVKVNGRVNGEEVIKKEGEATEAKVPKLEEVKEESKSEEEKKVNGDVVDSKSTTVSEIIDKAVDNSMDGKVKVEGENDSSKKVELKHFIRKSGKALIWRNPKYLDLPFTPDDTTSLHDKVAHAWLDGGKVLQLTEPIGENEEAGLELFRQSWLRGRPVLVCGVTKNNDHSLWCPKYFSGNFSDINADFINVTDGLNVNNEQLKAFWEGFQDQSKRKIAAKHRKNASDANANGNSSSSESSSACSDVVLKMRDWPPDGEEFSEALPDHARDLLSNLPLARYTARRALLNMADCLPEVFVKSDLGPHPCFIQGLGGAARRCCSINLHYELTDSVSILLNCSPTLSCSGEATVRLIEESLRSKLDDVTRSKIIHEGRMVGCVWQIFHPVDADKIRDFLNKTDSASRELDFDPLHETSRSISGPNLDKLRNDYGVTPYNVVQFVGEAVLVPAGAPRQVITLFERYKVC